MKKAVWKNIAQFLAAVLFLLAVWGIAYFVAGNELLVPPLGDCLLEAGALLADGGFWSAFFHTLLRVLLAFLPAFVLAVGFALIAYLSPTFRGFFAPVVSVLRSTPTLAVLLIILVWSGAGGAPVIVAFLSLFPALYASMCAAFSQVDEKLVEMSRVYRVPTKVKITRLYLPAIAPYAFQESCAGIAFALKLVISAEVLARTARSLGGMMQDAKTYMEMPTLFALVCVTVLAGMALEGLGALSARLLRRREE